MNYTDKKNPFNTDLLILLEFNVLMPEKDNVPGVGHNQLTKLLSDHFKADVAKASIRAAIFKIYGNTIEVGYNRKRGYHIKKIRRKKVAFKLLKNQLYRLFKIKIW